MFAVRFLVFCAVFSVSYQAGVISESPNISETDNCQMSCGTKGKLPLTELAGKFYYFHVDDTKKKNWFEAYNFCKQHNMELVGIETAAENEAINQKLLSMNDNGYYWIGINDMAKEGEYRWVGTGEVARFTNWKRGEPTNTGGNEHCTNLFKTNEGLIKWNDVNCTGYTSRFICEVTSKNLLYMHAN